MSSHPRIRRWIPSRVLYVLAFVGVIVLGQACVREPSPEAVQTRDTVFTVNGQVALHSLLSLSDGHLQKMADVLTILAETETVQSGEWERIREPLAAAARRTVAAVHWFARPDGAYWTLDQGRVDATLSDRPYFDRVLDGKRVIGELVVSRSTNRNTAIVAVPVRQADGSVAGVLGSSIHLDSLSSLIREQLGGLDDDLFFYAIDEEPLGALHSDSTLIFTEPMKLGDEGMRQAFREILGGERGVVTYTFRDSPRTVLYRRSPVSGWWYGFGWIQ